MRKIPLFLTALLAVLLSVIGYLYFSISLFSPAKVTTSLDYTINKSSDSFQCYQTDKSVSPFTSQEFNIVVWNIHKGSDPGWQSALRQYAEKADFLLLQEVTNQQNIQQLINFPTSIYVSAFSYRKRESGVNLLSKTAPHYFCAGSEQEPWIIIPKVGVAAAYPLTNGESLLIVNLHLVNFEWTPTNYKNQLTPMINQISQHKGPIILAGDFNSWNDGRIELLNDLTTKNNLQEVQFTADYRLQFLSHPLDHIYVRGLNIKVATTTNTESSDHNPLFATFTIKDNQ
ncbi:endonuclease/exonuclease/phosphatase (EEP) superfamily protein YafD [Cricetibacter osteomyelitidis]|uniref:Endonuclease/exonuclease/phosphatase (EEP) superfamily protein YafD n=1 Tax=Cricetibacter osteomyelitidis TaxID=1521931 RepID=A0A4R2SWF4_9PAST|nr:endonuclease/exonuclease/phosphatase family protein [Cricetibacter osteomyelitidis]TCP94809.1 endonuclease/exonuclease/phosphatase (EEP) superfamily protein YafD [Cricetibacter osteomyelitidis]